MEKQYPVVKKEAEFRELSDDEIKHRLRHARGKYRSMVALQSEGYEFIDRKGPEWYDTEISILEKVFRERCSTVNVFGDMKVLRKIPDDC